MRRDDTDSTKPYDLKLAQSTIKRVLDGCDKNARRRDDRSFGTSFMFTANDNEQRNLKAVEALLSEDASRINAFFDDKGPIFSHNLLRRLKDHCCLYNGSDEHDEWPYDTGYEKEETIIRIYEKLLELQDAYVLDNIDSLIEKSKSRVLSTLTNLEAVRNTISDQADFMSERANYISRSESKEIACLNSMESKLFDVEIIFENIKGNFGYLTAELFEDPAKFSIFNDMLIGEHKKIKEILRDGQNEFMQTRSGTGISGWPDFFSKLKNMMKNNDHTEERTFRLY